MLVGSGWSEGMVGRDWSVRRDQICSCYGQGIEVVMSSDESLFSSVVQG